LTSPQASSNLKYKRDACGGMVLTQRTLRDRLKLGNLNNPRQILFPFAGLDASNSV
jgi:hypothetical protein